MQIVLLLVLRVLLYWLSNALLQFLIGGLFNKRFVLNLHLFLLTTEHIYCKIVQLFFSAACIQLVPNLANLPQFKKTLELALKKNPIGVCELLQVAGPLKILAHLATKSLPHVRFAALRAASSRLLTCYEYDIHEMKCLLNAIIQAAPDSEAFRCIGSLTAWPCLELESQAANVTICALSEQSNHKIRAQAFFALSNLAKLAYETQDNNSNTTGSMPKWPENASKIIAVELARYDADFEAYNGTSRALPSALRASGYLLHLIQNPHHLANQLIRVCTAATTSSLASAKTKRNACLAIGQGFDGIPKQLRSNATFALVSFLQAHHDHHIDDQRKALAFAALSLTKAAHDLNDKAAALLAAIRALRYVDTDGPFPPESPLELNHAPPRLPDFPSQRLRLFTDLSLLVVTLLDIAQPGEIHPIASDLSPHLDFIYIWLSSQSASSLPTHDTPSLLDKIVYIFASSSPDHDTPNFLDHGLAATLDRFTVRARILRRRQRTTFEPPQADSLHNEEQAHTFHDDDDIEL
uniref:Uncharacterized protein n=1 Tax=Aureoumbra lagunensis TaxID=44058 RepID=A0A7S3NK10_9STRA